MPPPPPKKPEVRAANPPLKPSEWSPRSIQQGAPGRSTADPRTPRLSELAARERARAASLLAATPTTAWVAARILLDGRPAAGVPLRVVAPDGTVHTTRTDASGAAQLTGLTPGEATVSVSDDAWPPPPPSDQAQGYVPDVEEYEA